MNVDDVGKSKNVDLDPGASARALSALRSHGVQPQIIDWPQGSIIVLYDFF